MSSLPLLASLFLSFALLFTSETSLYLAALQNLSDGPRTETREASWLNASFRETAFSKRRVEEQSGSCGDSSEANGRLLVALLAGWPQLQLSYQAVLTDIDLSLLIARPLHGQAVAPRAPPAHLS